MNVDVKKIFCQSRNWLLFASLKVIERLLLLVAGFF